MPEGDGLKKEQELMNSNRFKDPMNAKVREHITNNIHKNIQEYTLT